jgi:hypothetical protein
MAPFIDASDVQPGELHLECEVLFPTDLSTPISGNENEETTRALGVLVVTTANASASKPPTGSRMPPDAWVRSR